MTNLSDRYYVMTYGTLMQGQYNHIFMQEAQGEFIDKAISVDEKFTMLSVHESFPAIVGGKSNFLGEIYAVPAEGILNVLDVLEGYPTHYDRAIFNFKGLTTGKEYKALTYIYTTESIYTMNSRLIDEKQSQKITLENNVYKWM